MVSIKLNNIECKQLLFELLGASVQSENGQSIQLSKGVLASKLPITLRFYLNSLAEQLKPKTNQFDIALTELTKSLDGQPLQMDNQDYINLCNIEQEIKVHDMRIEMFTNAEGDENFPILFKILTIMTNE